MAPRWRKVVTDIWHERTRTAAVVLAIALGIAAFSTVMSAYSILTRELDRGYLATNPASAILHTTGMDDAFVRSVRARPGIAGAEARRTVTGRLKVGPTEWRNLTLTVVADFADIRISTISPVAGAWPPRTGEILVERDAMQVARASLGGTVTVRTSRGSDQALIVSGVVKDVGRAQARMENIVYGYVTRDTLAALGEETDLDELLILVDGDAGSEPRVRTVANALAAWMDTEGYPVRRVEVPAPGKHPHSEIMGMLLLAKAAFGLFALALGGVLVVNLLSAIMASQARQIGIMKTLGATRWQVAGIYLAEAIALGGLAVAIAVPAGVWGGRVLCDAMARFLNFDVSSYAVPAWVYLLDLAVGLLVPALAALVPVLRGSAVTVRQALDDRGVNAASFGTTRGDRWLARTGGAARPVLLAVRNGFRHRGRTMRTLLTLSAAGLFFMAALNVRASLVNTLDRLFSLKRFHLSVSLATVYPVDLLEPVVGNTPGVTAVEAWVASSGAVAPGGDPATAPHEASGGPHAAGTRSQDRFPILGLPPSSALQRFDITSGRPLEADDSNAVVVNGALASRAGLVAGDDVSMRVGAAQDTWRVVGVTREPFAPPMAYVPRQYFERHGDHAGKANSVRLALADPSPAGLAAVRADLDRQFERAGIRAIASATQAENRYAFDQHMLMIYVFLIVVSGILAGVGGLGLMTAMSLNVLERRREMGVLRVIGATPRMIGLVVVAEGTAVALMGWAIASLLAWPVSQSVGNALTTGMFGTRLDTVFDPLGPLIWLACSLVLGGVASLVPAWQATRRPVCESIAYE